MRPIPLFLSAVLLLCRCSCFEPVGEPEGTDAGARDATHAADTSSSLPGLDASAAADTSSGVAPDASSCATPSVWSYVVRQIASIELMDGSARMGVTERLKVTLAASTLCERPGRIDAEFLWGNATDAIRLTGHAWVLNANCSAVPMTVILQVPGRQQNNLHAIATDTLDVNIRAEWERAPCSGPSDCACGPSTPSGTGTRGSTCRTDCSCAHGTSCIGAAGFGGPQWTCEVPCSDGSECAKGERCEAFVADGPSTVCLTQSCGPGQPCPEGFTCTATGCEDQRGMTDHSCVCDLDCGPGRHCIQVPGQGTPTCEVWCGDGMQCPFHESVFVCVQLGFCMPLD